MAHELVVGLDSSTQSAKAVAWTVEGRSVAEGRANIPMTKPTPGAVEQDPEDWWTAACTALRAMAAKTKPSHLAGLAISNQRETVAFLDGDGRAMRPGMVWLDERGGSMLAAVADALGADRLHAVTGKPVDLTPVLYRLAWMRAHEPATLDTARVVDVHGFLTGRLTGRMATSWTSADPFGVLDIASKAWSGPILDYLGMREEQFVDLVRPGAAVGAITAEAAAATGLPQGLPVFAAGGDGQCAGLGVNAMGRGRVYLNLGTAVITGAWSADPQIARWWRTLTAPTGEGYFLEGCQRAGAFLVDWFVDTFAGGRCDPGVFARLEAAAASTPIGCEGLSMCPYLTGSMDPHWDPRARASFVGLSSTHGLGHLYRAVLEALTLESARCVAAMRRAGLGPERVLAVGGGAQSALWTRMIADATGLPVTLSASPEASSLGAAMSAAVGLGWFDGFDAAAAAMSAEGSTVEPDPAVAEAWEEAGKRQAASYRPG